MQDILFDTKPEVIIEIGSFEGGFAVWMAHFCDAMNSDTRIIGVDMTERSLEVEHERIEWVVGDALDPAVQERVRELSEGRQGMVIEDSDHKYHITKGLLDGYAAFVAKGCYFLVEDTVVEILKLPAFPGPLDAVKEFIEERGDEFVIDRTREKQIMTYNPMGYLLRQADPA
jgi:cephalosporin hydroxylase